VLRDKNFWVGVIAGVIVYAFVWPMVSGMMTRGSSSGS
jgi:hypothetical protein